MERAPRDAVLCVLLKMMEPGADMQALWKGGVETAIGPATM